MAFGSNSLTILIKAKDEASAVLKRVQGTVEAHGAAFAKAGKAMLLASTALTAGLGLSIKQAASFQQSMAQVSTMLDQQSMKYMPAFEKAIKKMSMTYGEGTKTLADGLYNILSASIPAEKAISVLDASVRAAKAGLTDTGVAADAITTIINAYGLSAEKATDISDLLFAIVKRGKLTFAELAPNIGKVAALSAKAGLSLEDLGSTIATLTRSGVRTEMAMTAVRGILNAMLKPVDEAAAAFEDKLGVAMNTTTLKAEGIVGILTRMKKAGLTPEEISKMFPNVRALTGVVAAMGDLEGITYDYNLMLNRTGLSQEAFEKNVSTTEHELRKFKETLNIILVGLGAGLLPIVNKVAEAFVKLGIWFEDLSPTVKRLTAYSIALTAALLALSGIILIIVAKLPMIIVGFTMLAGVMGTATASAAALNIAIGVGAVGAFALIAVSVQKAINMLYDYASANISAREAATLNANMQKEAFGKLWISFNKGRESFNSLTDTVKSQAEEVDKLILGYREMSSAGTFSAEDMIAAEQTIVEAIIKTIQLKREAMIELEEQSARKKELKEEEVMSIEELTALEREAYDTLANDIILLDTTMKKKLEIASKREYDAKVKKMKNEIKDAKKQVLFMSEIDNWYVAKRALDAKTIAKLERDAKISIAQTTIDTLQAVLEAEGSSQKKKKAMIIALMTAELALGVTRMWSAEATKGVLGIPLAIAGTAALVANYGIQMHKLTSAKDSSPADFTTPTFTDTTKDLNVDTNNTGQSTPIPILNRYIVLNYIIKT